LLNRRKQDVDARDKRGHDENKGVIGSGLLSARITHVVRADPEISLIAAAAKV